METKTYTLKLTTDPKKFDIGNILIQALTNEKIEGYELEEIPEMNKADLRKLRTSLTKFFSEEAKRQGKGTFQLDLYTCEELLQAIDEYEKQ